ncbi:MAG: protease modulator HflK, partial [Aquabacterium sp.]|nr:protease modulator HflK [Aquabacterium sp.]
MTALPLSCVLGANRVVPASRATAIAALLVLTGCAGLPGAAPGTVSASAATKPAAGPVNVPPAAAPAAMPASGSAA